MTDRVPAGAVVGGLVLHPGEAEPRPATVTWSDGRIDAVGDAGIDPDPDHRHVIDADGALVVPGIVDVHGDAFERCIMPRAGVPVDVDVALAENDAQLLAAGITTAYLSATDSWEPGLRSRETLRELVGGLERRRGGPDVRLHVRHERCNTDDLDELAEWITGGVVTMLSYNDHTLGSPGSGAGADAVGRVSTTAVQRSGVDADALQRLQVGAAARRAEGEFQERRLAEVAAAAGCVTASHDAESEAHLERDLALGVTIAEFPTTIGLAARYRANDVAVLFGAPNAVRGRSHLGNLSVRDALAGGVGDVLCSDYHYPSLLQAPFALTAAGLLAFGPAWDLVAANAASAAGLSDRGRLAVGTRADLVVVRPPEGRRPATVGHAVVAGRPVRSPT